MLVNCPHCQTELGITPELIGQTVQCPACKGKFQVPSVETKQETSSRKKPQRTGWKERDHANVNFLKSFIIGTLITGSILGLMLPFTDSYIGALFLKRGWVNYAETFLFCWGMTILVMKWQQNQRQARAAMLELFPERLGREIHVDTVGGFIDNIYKISPSTRDSIIVNRIRKALELFENRPDNSEVTSFLSTQSDIDANRSSGSYALLKVFLWAIPILGFIGTVLGLSDAVGSLSMGDNADPAALKESISKLTGGLGVAFDTTLLGLVLSLVMSFPMAAVQKQEDETLTLIDAFCTDKLLPKLNDSYNPAANALLEKAESIPELVSSLARAHETFLYDLNAATRLLSEAGQTVQTSFKESIAQITDVGTESLMKTQEEMNKNLEKIATGFDLINKTLRDLGEKGIPDEAKKKRGLFGR